MTSDGTEPTNVTVAGDHDEHDDQTRDQDGGQGGEQTIAADGVPSEPAPDPAGAVPPVVNPGVDSTVESGAVDTGARRGGSGGGLLGGIAVVGAGLGVSSLIGNPLSDMLRSREEIKGQIEAGMGGGGADQIEAFYGAPWHTAAMVNGIVALVGLVVGALVLILHSRRSDSRPWITALAVGSVVFGLLGFLVAGGMYLDLFAAPPELPTAPALSPGG